MNFVTFPSSVNFFDYLPSPHCTDQARCTGLRLWEKFPYPTACAAARHRCKGKGRRPHHLGEPLHCKCSSTDLQLSRALKGDGNVKTYWYQWLLKPPIHQVIFKSHAYHDTTMTTSSTIHLPGRRSDPGYLSALIRFYLSRA